MRSSLCISPSWELYSTDPPDLKLFLHLKLPRLMSVGAGHLQHRWDEGRSDGSVPMPKAAGPPAEPTRRSGSESASGL
ncbi:hypothetical protein OJAV_G00072350 [Oryzias javanicus]|uniref:Uncharacterized protein n=1 Tax=Oryzias javanicus TaxID=123683 RepID=A0A437D9D1_ORYJA|nr:hypothetical protein OJAV_G00072350 [Oryzias javanicus]